MLIVFVLLVVFSLKFWFNLAINWSFLSNVFDSLASF